MVTSPSELAKYCKPGAPPARIAYRVPVNRKNFEVFCALAWIYCQVHGGALVVDELADVTTPGKAGDAWGEICRKSRASGSWVYATTQRPQEADKTCQGNATLIHCGMMSDSNDVIYLARRLLGGSVTVQQVAALKPLEYIERDIRTHTITTGKVRLRTA